jgi:hypothetical protein
MADGNDETSSALSAPVPAVVARRGSTLGFVVGYGWLTGAGVEVASELGNGGSSVSVDVELESGATARFGPAVADVPGEARGMNAAELPSTL